MTDEYDENGNLILTEPWEILGSELSDDLYNAIGDMTGAIISSPTGYEIEVEIDEGQRPDSVLYLSDAISAILRRLDRYPGSNNRFSLRTEYAPFGWVIYLSNPLPITDD